MLFRSDESALSEEKAAPGKSALSQAETAPGESALSQVETAQDGLLLEFGEDVIRILSKIRRWKSENNLSMRDETDCLVIDAPEKLHPLFRRTEKDLLACTKAKTILYTTPASDTGEEFL